MSLHFDDFIQSVYDEVGESAGYSQEYLAAWFAGVSNLGRLNNLIGSSYSGSYTTGSYGEITSYDIEPDLGGDEMAIYKKIFEVDFYNKQARNSLSGIAGAGSSSDWLTLKEGDSSITRINRNEIARTFKSLSTESREELKQMVDSYLKFRTLPQQVVGDDEISDGYYLKPGRNYRSYGEVFL